ncbi:Hypothetical predicted protein [Mytilus galloprovincialis]|uniref:Uncharacterized protein n=1 Tax=Mytilus galloprovincialis TaxID=29158 RepID=A0A8B6EB14_MYTGA|nr:Hypothetical predicted protein [Mytilus galloprovincialis]
MDTVWNSQVDHKSIKSMPLCIDKNKYPAQEMDRCRISDNNLSCSEESLLPSQPLQPEIIGSGYGLHHVEYEPSDTPDTPGPFNYLQLVVTQSPTHNLLNSQFNNPPDYHKQHTTSTTGHIRAYQTIAYSTRFQQVTSNNCQSDSQYQGYRAGQHQPNTNQSGFQQPLINNGSTGTTASAHTLPAGSLQTTTGSTFSQCYCTCTSDSTAILKYTIPAGEANSSSTTSGKSASAVQAQNAQGKTPEVKQVSAPTPTAQVSDTPSVHGVGSSRSAIDIRVSQMEQHLRQQREEQQQSMQRMQSLLF